MPLGTFLRDEVLVFVEHGLKNVEKRGCSGVNQTCGVSIVRGVKGQPVSANK